MKRTLFGFIVFAILCGGPVAAEDSEKTKSPDNEILKGLLFGESWGANRETLLSVIKDRFDTAWRAKASDLDAYEVDVEIRKSQQRYEEVVRSYTELDQNSAAYLASPLKGEFGLGLDQSLLRVKLKHGDRYFLFQSSRLAKVVEIVPAARFSNIESFRARQVSKLKVKSISGCDAEEKKAPEADAAPQVAFTACVIDKSRLFSAYLLRVDDPMTVWKQSERKKTESDEEVGLPDIFTEDPEAEDNQELVDEITGAKKRKTTEKKKATKVKPAKKGGRKKEKGLSDDEDVLY